MKKLTGQAIFGAIGALSTAVGLASLLTATGVANADAIGSLNATVNLCSSSGSSSLALQEPIYLNVTTPSSNDQVVFSVQGGVFEPGTYNIYQSSDTNGTAGQLTFNTAGTPACSNATLTVSSSSVVLTGCSLTQGYNYVLTNSSNTAGYITISPVTTNVTVSFSNVGDSSNGSTVFNVIQPFVSIYLPNIQSGTMFGGWLKISLPSGVSSSDLSFSVANTGVTCSPDIRSSGNNVYYVSLASLSNACNSSSLDWIAGVPLIVTINNSIAQPNNVLVYAYESYNGFFKRIPADITNACRVGSTFTY